MASFEERRVITCINYALPHYPLVLRSAKTPNVTVADSDSEKLTRKNQVSANEYSHPYLNADIVCIAFLVKPILDEGKMALRSVPWLAECFRKVFVC